MDRKKLINEFLSFFRSKKHKIIPNFSLIPENDPTVLFTTAGMHPLVPYLLGQHHPLGKRLCNVQRCIRTGDIEEVGDETHHTFFEMLGNWSLGDYFKKEAIEYSFEFLTKNLKISKKNLSVTCFKGEKDIPKDEEAAKIWKSLGISHDKIKFLGRKENWWGPAGKTGPCGPDTEMFVRGIEIWNDVFMQYNKTLSGGYTPLKQKNVDTGMGVERTLAILNKLNDNYLTDCFLPIIKKIEKISNKKYAQYKKEMRIIADHTKASIFIIADGIIPGNSEQGYVLRRLIRRAIRYGKKLGINKLMKEIANSVFEIYGDYEILKKDKKKIINELVKEEERFGKTIERGERLLKDLLNESSNNIMKVFQNELVYAVINHEEKRKFCNFRNKITEEDGLSKKNQGQAAKLAQAIIFKKPYKILNGKIVFQLYQSYGFPIELTREILKEKGMDIDKEGFEKELKIHQELSRTATQGKFKSGLADNSQKTTKLHTATHLLLAALRIVLDDKNIMQKGSNITAERLRLDFNFPRKLTQTELKKTEDLVNAEIQKSCEITRQEMSPKEAKEKGAIGVFDEKYGEKVSVYTIKDFSKEICAGPHVTNTCELGHFEITKEESSSAGIRRIKAIVE